MAPSKPVAAGAGASQEQSPTKNTNRTLTGRVDKSSPNTASASIPKGHDRYGPCTRCGGYKVRKRNNPLGSGPDAGMWAFVCSNRSTNNCKFYQRLPGDPLVDLQQRFAATAATQEEEMIQEQLQSEFERGEVEPVLSKNKMAVCPKCRRGHLIEREEGATEEYMEKYVECSRRGMTPGCDYQKLSVRKGFMGGNEGEEQEEEEKQVWDSLSYVAAVPAPPVQKVEKGKEVVDLTAGQGFDGEEEDFEVVGVKKVVKRGGGTTTTTAANSSNRGVIGGRRVGNSRERKEVVNLDDDDDEEVQGPSARAANRSKATKKKGAREDSFGEDDLDSDFDNDLIMLVDKVSKTRVQGSSGGRRL
ncbi:hypothetical protein QBC38DRAFT_520451 [Podospora fimiseda]|uniref:Uncharacterized protein n=1 Tax=Podospora fimiseda TaxID=252190 RepID=A0AAN7H6D7_9PEZI|nr:hypothetical protein QBC38DRAFT_520451 [Podospora fimiseda]